MDINELGQQLVEAAAEIKHCGDYGYLFLNKKTLEVYLTLGDADGDPDCEVGTPFEDIKEMLSLEGVGLVTIEAESFPTDDGESDDDWLALGQVGIDAGLEMQRQYANR
jgi:hypothetical protein